MATLYFYYGGVGFPDWANLSNWWTDSSFTAQASAIPGSGDSVVITNGSTLDDDFTVINLTVQNGAHIAPAGSPYTLTVTGTVAFEGSSYLGSTTISWSGATASFSNSSYLASGSTFTVAGTGTLTLQDSAYNSGTITNTSGGLVIFNGSGAVNSGAVTNAAVTDVRFNNGATNSFSPAGTVSYATFNNNSLCYGNVTYDAVLNDTVICDPPAIGGTVTFNNSSTLKGTGTINAVLFNDSSGIDAGGFSGTVTTMTFTGAAYSADPFPPGASISTRAFANNVAFTIDSSTWSADTENWTFNGTKQWLFKGSADNGGKVHDATFEDSSLNAFAGTALGNATFRHNSRNEGLASASDTATFEDAAYNASGATVGSGTFTGSSYNNGTVNSTESYTDRTPYPVPVPPGMRGINGSSILGVI
jgi:hypothetical protein